MTDGMRFAPSSIDVKQGETDRFVVTNSGKLKHELVLGTEKELKEHYEVDEEEPRRWNTTTRTCHLRRRARPARSIWQFTKAGKVDFACLQPGHYDAGMKGAVNVAKAPEK